MLTDNFHSHLAISWRSPPLWKETEKKRGEISQTGRGSEGCGKGACCCQSVCLPRPCPLPPRAAWPPATVISWLSSGKETAKQGTVYLCRLYSLHIPAAGLRHHSNLPGSAKKGSADLLSKTVCIEVPGVQINRRQCPSSVPHRRPNKPTSPRQPLPKSSLIHFQHRAFIEFCHIIIWAGFSLSKLLWPIHYHSLFHSLMTQQIMTWHGHQTIHPETAFYWLPVHLSISCGIDDM